MNGVKKTVVLLLLCRNFLFVMGSGNGSSTLPQSETRLKTLFEKITVKGTDEQNLLLADSITVLLNEALQLPGSFDYPFDQLKSMGKITSPDQKIRIFTWNLPFKDATNRFFGFVMLKTGNGNNVSIYRLTDQSATIADPAMVTLTANNWYGCLVYSIVEKKAAGVTYYTLLGYAPVNIFISRKLTDVLWFNEKNEPVFGKPLFHYNKRMQCRIVFEYAAKVQMSLKWNESMNMIIYDHLSPIKPSYAGNYQYYGPDLSYDALKFEKGVWETMEDVDVRNSGE